MSGTWTYQQKITASGVQAQDYFGSAVAIEGNLAVVAAPYDDVKGTDSGAAYLLYNSSGTWGVIGDKMVPGDASAAGDLFGFSVSVKCAGALSNCNSSEPTGATVLVSAHADDDAGSGSGSAYVFRWIDENIQLSEKFHASDAGGGDNFGVSVTLSDAPGHVIGLVGASGWDGTSQNTGAMYAFDGVSGQSTETLVYDDDGNLIDDGESYYVYDAENRLTETWPIAPQEGDLHVTFKHDYMGRRVRKVTQTFCIDEDPSCEETVLVFPDNSGIASAWFSDQVEDVRFIYDGWNLLMERTCEFECEDEVVKSKYAWGPDLSGQNGAAASGNAGSAVQGVGGIGGLLAREIHGIPEYEEPPQFLYFYDGNGNVGQVVTFNIGVSSSNPQGPVLFIPYGEVVEKYEYDPYGGTLLADDMLGLENPFRFSTKYFDVQPASSAAGERGLYYFGYRYYSVRLGRWLSRDPMGETNGANLYGFAANSTPNAIDLLGLTTIIVMPVLDVPPFPTDPNQPPRPDRPDGTFPGGPGGGGVVYPTSPPQGDEIPNSGGDDTNCLGESCGKKEWLIWPHLPTPCSSAEFSNANQFIPKGCEEITCGDFLADKPCCCNGGRELRLFTYRYPIKPRIPVPVPFFGLIFIDIYDCDFHVMGRDGCTENWQTKRGAHNRFENIQDPWTHLFKLYPKTAGNSKAEIVQRCFCCDPSKMESEPIDDKENPPREVK